MWSAKNNDIEKREIIKRYWEEDRSFDWDYI